MHNLYYFKHHTQ